MSLDGRHSEPLRAIDGLRRPGPDYPVAVRVATRRRVQTLSSPVAPRRSPSASASMVFSAQLPGPSVTTNGSASRAATADDVWNHGTDHASDPTPGRLRLRIQTRRRVQSVGSEIRSFVLLALFVLGPEKFFEAMRRATRPSPRSRNSSNVPGRGPLGCRSVTCRGARSYDPRHRELADTHANHHRASGRQAQAQQPRRAGPRSRQGLWRTPSISAAAPEATAPRCARAEPDGEWSAAVEQTTRGGRGECRRHADNDLDPPAASRPGVMKPLRRGHREAGAHARGRHDAHGAPGGASPPHHLPRWPSPRLDPGDGVLRRGPRFSPGRTRTCVKTVAICAPHDADGRVQFINLDPVEGLRHQRGDVRGTVSPPPRRDVADLEVRRAGVEVEREKYAIPFMSR